MVENIPIVLANVVIWIMYVQVYGSSECLVVQYDPTSSLTELYLLMHAK